jgi:pyruvate ferredoxin oxidoreductase beta subunit/2-oxoisovalerate ferredoxin oxidoreductase beta subunit
MGGSEKIKKYLEQNELVSSGHYACQGCGAPIAMRFVLKVLGPKTIVVLPASCWSIIAGQWPYTSVQLPLYHTAFETAASVASGVRAGLDIQEKKDINVLAWAGDGGTFDIGLQALSGAAERNEDIIFVCYDNEAYMNTGIQRSSATPYLSWTTTTPEDDPKSTPKKDMMQIMAAHRVPFCATANVAYPEDLLQKVEIIKKTKGTRFLHILSPCPPGWRMESHFSIKVARLATKAKMFPLYEIRDGDNYNITVVPEAVPVSEYFKLQGRFHHLTTEQIQEIQKRVDYEWQRLLAKAMFEKYKGTVEK